MEDDNETNSPFMNFYMRYAYLVTQAVAQKCPKNDVADVAQKAWLKLQAKFPFEGVRNIEAFLTRVAQNEVKQHLRERDAKKRPPPAGRMPLPDERPSGANLDARFIKDLETSREIDKKRLSESLHMLGEELSGNKGELMDRFLEHPSQVSADEFKKLAASARKNVKRLGAEIDPDKEGPSFLGHLAKKIKAKK